MSTREELLRAKDPSLTIAKKLSEAPSLESFIQDLGTFQYLPENVLGPFRALSNTSSQLLSKFTKSILSKFVKTLNNVITSENDPQKLEKILRTLLPYINREDLHSIFDATVSKMSDIPEDFLISLVDLPPSTFLKIFTSNAARGKLFVQCHPMFERCVLNVLQEYVEDYVTLDALITAPYVQYLDTSKISGKLTEYHSNATSKVENALKPLFCDCQDFYAEICYIITDMWKRTHNPLLAALRLQLVQSIERAKLSIKDDDRLFARAMFDSIDDIKKVISPGKNIDNIIYVRDPMLRAHLINYAHRAIRACADSESKFIYKDPIIVALAAVICPRIDDGTREDIFNDLTALWVCEKHSIVSDEFVRFLLEEAASHQDAATFIASICVRSCEMGSKLHGALLAQILESSEEMMQIPDAVFAHILLRYISVMIASRNPQEEAIRGHGIALISNWAHKSDTVLAFFISFLGDLAEHMIEERSVARWLKLVEDAEGNDTIESMRHSILSSIEH